MAEGLPAVRAHGLDAQQAEVAVGGAARSVQGGDEHDEGAAEEHDSDLRFLTDAEGEDEHGKQRGGRNGPDEIDGQSGVAVDGGILAEQEAGGDSEEAGKSEAGDGPVGGHQRVVPQGAREDLVEQGSGHELDTGDYQGVQEVDGSGEPPESKENRPAGGRSAQQSRHEHGACAWRPPRMACRALVNWSLRSMSECLGHGRSMATVRSMVVGVPPRHRTRSATRIRSSRS